MYMMDSHWLLFNTSLCRWIVTMCYIFKFKVKNFKAKEREYRIEFDEIQRYWIKLNYYAEKNLFNVKILLNDKFIAMYVFENPAEFCQKLKAETSPSIVKFVDLILLLAGFRL